MYKYRRFIKYLYKFHVFALKNRHTLITSHGLPRSNKYILCRQSVEWRQSGMHFRSPVWFSPGNNDKVTDSLEMLCNIYMQNKGCQKNFSNVTFCDPIYPVFETSSCDCLSWLIAKLHDSRSRKINNLISDRSQLRSSYVHGRMPTRPSYTRKHSDLLPVNGKGLIRKS